MSRRNKSNKSSTQSVSEDSPEGSIHAKLDLILQRLDGFDSRLKKLEMEQAEIVKSCSFLSDELDAMKSVKNEFLHYTKNMPDIIERLEQVEFQQRKKQLTVHGIPYKKGEDLLYALKIMSDKLECELNPKCDIDSIYRVKQSDNIVVKFIHNYKRDNFLSAFRKNPLTTKDIGFNDERKLYTNEVLSKSQAELFHKVRIFKRENKYRYAWTANQRLFLRKDSDSDAILITSARDLDAI